LQVTDNALRIMRDRVLHEGETPADMVDRVAGVVSCGNTHTKEQFKHIMEEKYFLPNSPCLVNSGTKIGQLSACFVLPIEDSIESIMGTLYNAAIIQKTGGGVGFNFSELRPKGARVDSTGGEASGPVSFMRMFNATMEEIKQGGRRRGASLAVLNCDHEDILEFINCKEEDGRLNNFNISVGITDDFMRNKDEEVWQAIAEGAWRNGEPGVLFVDTVNLSNPRPELGEINACNPCGESTLLPYESCVLGSINLSKMVKGNRVDYDLLKRVTRNAYQFLDSVIDATNHPLEEIEEATRRTRKIGIGVMGLADMLYQVGLPYYSDEARELAGEVMDIINHTAAVESQASPAAPETEIGKRRNAVVTSIAPTGTISAIAGCSSGIEPAFALVYTKTILGGQEFDEVNPVFEDMLRKAGVDFDSVIEQVKANNGSCQGIKEIPEDIRRVFVTAQDLKPTDHVLMQSELQKHVEQSISKTINLPESATVEQVKEVLQLAWEEGCKGVTVYRDGSRQGQVLSTKHKPKERPHKLTGETAKYKTGCGSLYVTVNSDILGEPHEVFANHSFKGGGCSTALLNSLARITSIALRSGVDQGELSRAMSGQVCGKCNEISSCADALSRAIAPQVCSIGCKTCD